MRNCIILNFLLLITSVNLIAQTELSGASAKKYHSSAEQIRLSAHSGRPDFFKFRSATAPEKSDFINWYHANIRKSNESIDPASFHKDKLNYEHQKYQVKYKGYPVEGSVIISHTDGNKIASFNGQLYELPEINCTASLTEKSALDAALEYFKAKKYRWEVAEDEAHLKEVTGDNDATYFPNGKLVVAAVNGDFASGNFRLAYKFDIYAVSPLKKELVFVDAIDGKILHHENQIFDTDQNGTAYTRYSGTKAIKTSLSGSNFVLRESGRGSGIETYNLNNGTSRTSAVDFLDSDNSWNNVNSRQDEVATDAHFGAETTYDYYLTKHGRNSFDNLGGKLLSYVHYSTGYNNAYWDGYGMTYGDGDGYTFTPLTALDVCGHELTHGVTEKTAGLVYSGESGALNEAFSDMFGTMVEFYGKSTTTGGNFLIGEDITPDHLGLRNMANPKLFNEPDTYRGTYWVDGADVHDNSAVANRWFYVLCSGAAGTNDLGNSYSVTGVGIDKAAQIAYRTLTTYLTPNVNYSDARYFSILAASDLYGACSPEVTATTMAWYSVGVGGLPSNTLTAAFSANRTFSCSLPATFNFVSTSTNASTYLWTFGDGSTSASQNPSKTYTVTGTYSVKLKISGSSSCIVGSDSIAKVSYITVTNTGSPIAATCSPITTSTTNNGGILNFKLGTIDNTTNGGSDGYKDYTCSFSTNLKAGKSFTISINTPASGSNENVRVWIDYNNDGAFSTAEQVLASNNKAGTHTGSFIVPGSAITNTPLRVRAASDVYYNTAPAPCTNVQYGQFEDYAVNITPSAEAPQADFTSDFQTVSPGSYVVFTDKSLNVPTSWRWIFSGASPTTATGANAVANYSTLGTYDVKLVVTNAFGGDSIVKTSYINVANTANMCSGSTVTSALNGKIFDSGGPLSGYQNNENCQYLISPTCGATIALTFQSLDLESCCDYIKIYNGNSISAPLIYSYNGSVPTAPIIATSGKMLIVFYSDYSVTKTGFEASWVTTVASAPTIANFSISNTNPYVGQTVYFGDLSSNGPSAWAWNFSGEGTSSLQSPPFVFSTTGVKNISLSATNCISTTGILKTLTVLGITVTDITPNPTSQSSYVNVNGVGLIGITSVYYKNTYGSTISTSFNNYSTYLRVYIPSDAVTAPLTLTGSFGNLISPVLTVSISSTPFMCMANAINSGGIAPISSVQSVTGYSGNGYYWTFSGINNTAYRFSTCGASEDTYLRIYNSRGSLITSNDDNGVVCSGTAASLEWLAPASDTYYVLLSHYSCSSLYYTTVLNYNTIIVVTPTVTGIDPNPTSPNSYVTVSGSGFANMSYVYYHTSNGYNYTTNYTNYSNYLKVYIPSDAVTSTLTLTGSFGRVVTPVLTISYAIPTITGISPNPTSPGSYVSIVGSGFNNVNYVYYRNNSGYNYSTSFSNYGSYLWVYIPTDAVTNTLTLTGGFGNSITSVLTVTYFTPAVTTINPNPTSPGSYISLVGSNFNNVSYLYYHSSNGYDYTTSFNNYGSYLYTYIPTDAITSALTLTGGFGRNITPVLTITYFTPTVTSINSNPTTQNSYVYINGSGFNNVSYIYYKSNTGNTYSTSFSNNNSYLYTNIPNDAVTGSLTLTGGFGNVITPILTVNISSTSFMCMSNAVNSGGITPMSTVQSVVGSAGNGYYWTFSGINSSNYRFSTCGAGEDTYLRIYNSTGILMGSNDDYGPACSSSAASIDWQAPASGTYYVLLTHYSCSSLNYNTTLNYNTIILVAPTVTGITPNPTSPGSYVSITGSGFSNVNYVYYHSSYGYDYTAYFTNNGSYLSVYIPTDAVTSTLTLTGSFGKVVTPVLTVTYAIPTVNGINPNPTSSDTYVNVNGSGFSNVDYIYYTNTYGYTYSTYFTNYTSYLQVYIPNDAVTGTLTLTGGFGRSITPVLTVTYFLPSVTNINPNPTSPGSYVNVNGSSFEDVNDVYYRSVDGTIYDTYFYDYGNYLEVYIPDDAVTSTLTLTGSFGRSITPVLTVTYFTPVITSISPNPTSPDSYVNINGSSFDNVGYVYYRSTDGADYSTYFYNEGTYLEAYIPSDAVTHTLTLTGGFGRSISPVLTVTYFTPVITSITPNPTTPDSYTYIYGNSFDNVDYLYYRSTDGSDYSTYFYNGGTYLEAYIPSDAVTHTLTLTGGFGRSITPVLTVTYFTPVITSINPNPTSPSSYVDIYGSSFDNVDYVYYRSSNGINYSTSIYFGSNYLEVYIPSDAVTSTLTLTGGFGRLITPVLTVTNFVPVITSISPNPTVPSSYVNVYGSNFTNVSSVYYRSSNGNNYTLSFSNYGSYLNLYIPSDARTGTLTLTGTFGRITTSVLTVNVSNASFMCISNPVNGGGINPISTVQTVVGLAGGGYYWTFSGINNAAYRFSTCGSSYDTYLRIYDSNGNIVGSNDDGGPACSSSAAASLDWTAAVTGMYYVLLTEYTCANLYANTQLKYNSIIITTPTVTSINANPTTPDSYVTVNGSGFTNVNYIYYRTTNGYIYSTNFTNYTSYLQVYIPSDAVTSSLTLTGVFGRAITPVLTVTYFAPTITGISPNPTSPSSYVNVYGSFNNVNYVYYRSSNGYNYTTNFSNYTTYLQVYIPSDAVTSPLTLSGGFGRSTTPVLTVTYFTPAVTSVSPNPTSPSSYVNVYGSNFNNVNYVYYRSSNGYNYTTSFSNYTSYLQVYIPSDAVTSPLTLSGGFGSSITPVLTVTYFTPAVISISPNPTSPSSYVNVYGSNFNNVNYVYYRSSNGYNYTTSFSNYTSYIQVYIPSDAVTSTLTLTGGFGRVVTPVLTVSYITPTVTSINPNPTSPASYVNVNGSGFTNVSYVYYRNTSGYIYTAYFSSNSSYLQVYMPSDAVTSTLTLTGSFGRTITPVLTVSSLPLVTSISPNPTLANAYVYIYGSNFSNVNNVFYISNNGYTYSTVFTNYGSYLYTLIPSDAVTGTLTLTGSFGRVVTPVLTIGSQGTSFLCMQGIRSGGISPTASVQNVYGYAGNGYYWTFTGINSTSYRFSTCNSSEDSYLAIYNSSGTLIAENDDYGPACSTSRSASIDFTPPSTGTYYVLLTHYDCVNLTGSVTLSYNTISLSTAITSISPNPTPSGAYVYLYGSGLNSVSDLYYKSSSGYNYETSFNSYGTYIYAYIPTDAITSSLTLTGSFGRIITSVLTVTSGAPIITSISPNPVSPGGYVYISGSTLSDITYLYYTSTDGSVNTTTYTNNGSYLYAYIPYDAITSTLTVTGNFGRVTTPILNVNTAGISFMCMSNAVRRGGITPGTTVQNVSGSAGNGYFWTFAGINNTSYTFSTCGALENTYLRIYDSNGNLKASNDDHGPACATSAASISWTSLSTETYYVLLTGSVCSSLASSVNLYYNIGNISSLPSANFSSDHQSVSAGQQVQFTGLNASNITSWKWTFAGGSPASSALANPVVNYLTTGTYDVKLVVKNSYGKDSTIKSSYITVTKAVPNTTPGANVTYNMCDVLFSNSSIGKLYDGGGPSANYNNNSNCYFQINSTCPGGVLLSFTSVNIQEGYDYIKIYDGTSNISTKLLAIISGATLPKPVQSVQKNMMISFTSDNAVTASGFEAQWQCAVVTGIEDVNVSKADLEVFPNPAKGFVNLQLETDQPSDIDIYNMIGVKLYNSQVQATSTLKEQVDIDGWPSGLYIVKINTGGKSYTKSFVVE